MNGGIHHNAVQPLGRLSPLTCPECGGSLSEQQDGALLRYRCHTGHVYDGRHLLTLQIESVEQALWSAVRAHDERATLLCAASPATRAPATASRRRDAGRNSWQNARKRQTSFGVCF